MVCAMQKKSFRQWFAPAPPSELRRTEALAEQGDAQAQFGLGLKYGNATGEALDFPKAAQWYRKAADQNHTLAQFNLGVMYARGQGMPVDDVEAARWINKAAELGDAAAQYNLGERCDRAGSPRAGNDLESRIEAYKWYHLAAAQGYKGSEAACELINLYLTREQVLEGNQRAARFQERRAALTPTT